MCHSCATAFASKEFNESQEFFKEHLQNKQYALDPTAKAIVLYESLVFSTDNDMKGEYFTTSKVRRIIKILTKEGVDVADVRVALESSVTTFGGITKVKAATYNLVNGEVDKTEMAASAIKIEKASENMAIGKFSLPNVSEGSIIDYTYETKQELSSVIGKWKVQEQLPKLVSEVSVTYPEMITLALLTNNIPEFEEYNDKAPAGGETSVSYYTPTIPTGGGYYKSWVRKNIQGYKVEPFLYNVENFSEWILFKVGSVKISATYGRHTVTNNSGLMDWTYLNSKLKVNKKAFGKLSEGGSRAAAVFLKNLGAKPPSKDEYARKIYAYIRDNFTLKDEGMAGSTREIVWTLNNKAGNRFDYHLALISCLREAGMEANPVLLSTRDKVKLMEDNPNLDNINYIVTRMKVDDKIFYLDPTNKYNPFGVISAMCYNGFAWVVNDTGFGAMLDPADIKEKVVVQAKTISNDAKDYQLNIKKVFGKQAAVEKRTAWVRDSLAIKKEVLEELKVIAPEAKLLDYSVENLNNPDLNLSLAYTIQMDFSSDKLFFNPSLFNYYSELPLKSEKRYNPVEMPFPVEAIYSLYLELPKNYVVEESPQSAVLTYDENNFYKYLIDYNEESQSIMLNTKFNFQRAFFQPDEYKVLKNYFEKVIETQGNNLVIKKQS